MSLLEQKLSALLTWERSKWREQNLLEGFCYAFLLAFLLSPARAWWPLWLDPLSAPILFFLVVTAAVFVRRPWGDRERLKAVLRLDRTLGLQERALTAWEILRRRERRPAELLVIEEAQEKLREVDPRALFVREKGWRLFLAPALFFLWIAVMGFHFIPRQDGSEGSLAQRVKRFSAEIVERAKSHELEQSRRVAREAAEAAEKRIEGRIGEKELREQLAAIAGKIPGGGGPGSGERRSSMSAEQESLAGLKKDIEKWQAALASAAGAASEMEKLLSELLQKLASMPGLQQRMEDAFPSFGEGSGAQELAEALAELAKTVGAELDRLALQDMKDFLGAALQRGPGDQLEGMKGREPTGTVNEGVEADSGSSRDEEKAQGSQPGDRPGSREYASQALPPYKGRALTHLKGLLREGKGKGVKFRGEFATRGSQLSPQEWLTSYKRQAEEDLAGEQIPAEVKESIRKYFAALE